MTFRIDTEIRSLLQPLRPEERAGLKSLIQDGEHVDDGIVGCLPDGDRILADGHNRSEICGELGMDFPFRDKDFASRAELIEWVINNQLGRRNLTDERRAYFIGKKYLESKQPHGGQQGLGERPSSPSAHSAHSPQRTAEKIGEEHGVNQATVRRNADFAEAVDAIAEAEGPEARDEILNGESGMSKAEVIERSGKKTPPRKPLPPHNERRTFPRVVNGQAIPGSEDDAERDGNQGDAYEEPPAPRQPEPPAPDQHIKKAIDALGIVIRALDRHSLFAKHKTALDAIAADLRRAR